MVHSMVMAVIWRNVFDRDRRVEINAASVSVSSMALSVGVSIYNHHDNPYGVEDEADGDF